MANFALGNKKREKMINKHHIWIKECCASCWYKIIRDEKGRRFCRKARMTVPADGRCQDWKLSKGLEEAGRGGGTVKLINEKTITDKLILDKQENV